MLETRTLLLRARTPDGVRPIVDAGTGAPLGYAHQTAPGGPAWWRWLAGPVLEVREQDDEPLLFTVRRAWALLPRREVRDAEGHWVGTLLGPYLEDRYGRRVAAVQEGPGLA